MTTYRTSDTALLCPRCGTGRVAVTDSRPSAKTIRRRRMCRACGYRWSTIEVEPNSVEGVISELAGRLRAAREAYDALGLFLARLEGIKTERVEHVNGLAFGQRERRDTDEDGE